MCINRLGARARMSESEPTIFPKAEGTLHVQEILKVILTGADISLKTSAPRSKRKQDGCGSLEEQKARAAEADPEGLLMDLSLYIPCGHISTIF